MGPHEVQAEYGRIAREAGLVAKGDGWGGLGLLTC